MRSARLTEGRPMSNSADHRKERAITGGIAMARNRTQRGSIRWRSRSGSKGVWEIRYRVRTVDGWKEKAEALPGIKESGSSPGTREFERGKSKAQETLRSWMGKVNQDNNTGRPLPMMFASFASGPLWRAYLEKQKVKP